MFQKISLVLMSAFALCFPSVTLGGSPASATAGPAGYSWFLVDAGADVEDQAALIDEFLAHQAAQLWEFTLERPSTSNTRSGQVRLAAAGSPFERRQGNDGNRLLRWPRVKAGDWTWQIAVEAEIRQRGEELRFVFRVENEVPGWIVRELRAPIVGRIAADRLDLLWPDSLGRRVRDLEAVRAARLLYPGWASMQWFALVANDERGLYVGSHDDTFQTTALGVDCDPDTRRLEAAITKYPLL